MSLIHPTAIIDPAATLDPTVQVGPFSIIEGPVTIGAGTKIMSHARICGRTVVGSGNVVHMGVFIGGDPQHLAYKGGDAGIVIGDNNVFREYVTVHKAYHEGANTTIGDGNYFMANSHVAHDCRLGNNIIMANGALLAGHCTVQDRANISGNVAVHQFVTIGRLAMVGGLTKVVKDVPPYMIANGPDGEIHGLNTVGLRRSGMALEARTRIKEAYRLLYRSGFNVPNAVEEIERTIMGVPEVDELVQFIRKSIRGISRHTSIHAEQVPQE